MGQVARETNLNRQRGNDVSAAEHPAPASRRSFIAGLGLAFVGIFGLRSTAAAGSSIPPVAGGSLPGGEHSTHPPPTQTHSEEYAPREFRDEHGRLTATIEHVGPADSRVQIYHYSPIKPVA